LKLKYDKPLSSFAFKFNLRHCTVDFVGHALALQENDNYLDQPARKMVTARRCTV
jgi:RAB protein geranylgeranyltransferase component A